jgi:hypothetical protein
MSVGCGSPGNGDYGRRRRRRRRRRKRRRSRRRRRRKLTPQTVKVLLMTLTKTAFSWYPIR